MLQSMGSQRVRHDLATEKKKNPSLTRAMGHRHNSEAKPKAQEVL